MKPFNLEKALAGAPVVTRHGRTDVRIAGYEKGALEFDRLLGWIGNASVNWAEDGRQKKFQTSDFDLFMASTKREGWVNVYADNLGLRCGLIYPTEEAAQKAQTEMFSTTATAKIEWEE